MTVLYEDNHIIIVNKESGEIVQGDKTSDTPLSDVVKAYIKERYHKPGNVFLGVVHRLDRPVQGLVLFAKTSKALSRLNEMFREKNDDLQKTYWAIVPSQHPSSAPSLTRSSAPSLVPRDSIAGSSLPFPPPPNSHFFAIGLCAMSRRTNPLPHRTWKGVRRLVAQNLPRCAIVPSLTVSVTPSLRYSCSPGVIIRYAVSSQPLATPSRAT